ncbi:MAG TPA: phosphatase PAP2 family protein [Nitrospira sp.]|nr:phosphatase PAP2 family protein [Nitrospira sp.]
MMNVLHASMPAMNLDESLFYTINGLAGQAPVRDQFFLHLGAFGTFYVPIILAIGYWIWIDWREAVIGGATLVTVVGLVDFLGGQLKWLVERVRPCRALTQAVVLEPGGCGGLYSFPSNHALNTAAAAAFLQVLYPRSGWLSWPIVALVGFSRVYVGAHYVSDIVASWLMGGLSGAGVAWLLLQWPKFRQRMLSPMVSTQANSSAP